MTSEHTPVGRSGGRGRPQAVALIGFMGAGKTAVGRELAAALDVPFVDTDDLIAAKAGPVAAIFAERGEAGFRALEADVVTAAIADAHGRPCVLALGGGAVLSDVVREALTGIAHVVWLAAPPEELWMRVVTEGPECRPLARDEESFRALLAAREPLYRAVATEVVQTAGRTVAAVAAGIAADLDESGAGAACERALGGAS